MKPVGNDRNQRVAIHRLIRYLCVTPALPFALSICQAETGSSVLLRILDGKDQTLAAQTIEWWQGDMNQKRTLICQKSACAEWIIEDHLDFTKELHVLATRQKEDDKYCWDLYEGRTVIDPDQKKVALTLHWSETVCK